jgi:hypothetical protein
MRLPASAPVAYKTSPLGLLITITNNNTNTQHQRIRCDQKIPSNLHPLHQRLTYHYTPADIHSNLIDRLPHEYHASYEEIGNQAISQSHAIYWRSHGRHASHQEIVS